MFRRPLLWAGIALGMLAGLGLPAIQNSVTPTPRPARHRRGGKHTATATRSRVGVHPARRAPHGKVARRRRRKLQLRRG